MTTAALPEVKRHDKLARANRLTNIALLVIVGVACLIVAVGALVLYVKIDGKVSHTQATTDKLRAAQIVNAHKSSARSDCQNRAFNALLKDAQLAFSGDKNPADYSVAVKC